MNPSLKGFEKKNNNNKRASSLQKYCPGGGGGEVGGGDIPGNWGGVRCPRLETHTENGENMRFSLSC